MSMDALSFPLSIAPIGQVSSRPALWLALQRSLEFFHQYVGWFFHQYVGWFFHQYVG
jgi:hypothetical protein